MSLAIRAISIAVDKKEYGGQVAISGSLTILWDSTAGNREFLYLLHLYESALVWMVVKLRSLVDVL